MSDWVGLRLWSVPGILLLVDSLIDVFFEPRVGNGRAGLFVLGVSPRPRGPAQRGSQDSNSLRRMIFSFQMDVAYKLRCTAIGQPTSNAAGRPISAVVDAHGRRGELNHIAAQPSPKRH